MSSRAQWCGAVVSMATWTLLGAWLVTCAAAAGVSAGKHDFYKGYSLYEVSVSTEEQLRAFQELEISLELDVWRRLTPTSAGRVLVSPQQQEQFLSALQAADIDISHAQDIVQLLEEEDRWIANANTTKRDSASPFTFAFDHYPRYDDVDRYLVDLAAQYPDTVTVVSGGSSYENRDIKHLRISTTGFQDHRKPVVMIQSLMHAREWITLPTTLYAIHKLVEEVTERDLVEEVDWIIVPIVNPDGYEHSHTSQRLHRKNRSTGHSILSFCTGVDLNRNFDFVWGTDSSNSGCSETFHGPAPFSESETEALRVIIDEHAHRIKLFVDIHSYGSYILYGWGHSGVLPPNGLQLHLLGVQMAQSIDMFKHPPNPDYIVGNSALTLYSASGLCSDYAQSKGIPYSYTYELPEFNRGTFIVNPQFILQAASETWEGLKVGVRHVARVYSSRA